MIKLGRIGSRGLILAEEAKGVDEGGGEEEDEVVEILEAERRGSLLDEINETY